MSRAIVQVEWFRQKTPIQVLTMSPFSWGTMSSVEIWEKTSSWYVRFTMKKGCVYVSGSTYLHMCIGLARMQGVWWRWCRWLMNFQVNQTRKLHHKIFSKFFDMCRGKILRMDYSKWWYSFMVEYDSSLFWELWLLVQTMVAGVAAKIFFYLAKVEFVGNFG